MGCIRELLRYLVYKQLASYGNVVDYIYEYFVHGINDPRKHGLTSRQGRSYVHRVREICFSDYARIRAILRRVYGYVKGLVPVLIVDGSKAVCKLCGKEFRFASSKCLMIAFSDHLRYSHGDYVDWIISYIIDSIRNELRGEDDDGGGS